jgi:MoaA/NifB/PqqE/SkfB family radical SAM enzyme
MPERAPRDSTTRRNVTTPRLALHLTDRCQLDCQHCLRDPGRKSRDLDFDLVAKVLAEGRRVYGLAHVTFTGGEPTLHPRFDAIVDLVADHGMTWNVVTNGRAFPAVLARLESRPERLRSLKSIVLSLDGSEEATHDAIRERGSYREVMAAAAICATRQLPFGFQMTIQARNQGEIEGVGLMAGQLGAHRVLYAMMQPTGTVHDEALFLPATEWRRIHGRLERLATALAIPVELAEGHYEKSRFSVCDAWRGETLHVDVDGRLTLCCLHAQVPSLHPDREVAGDLRELSLVDAHRRLLELIRRTQDETVAALAGTEDSAWDHFHCNRCLGSFGKPHWTESGASGPSAQRERWHGVWAPGEGRHAAPPGTAPPRRRLGIVQ